MAWLRFEVAEWSQTERRFVPLPLHGMLEDPTLMQPIPIRALLDAAFADNAVAAALRAKDNPWLVRREQDLSAHALLLVLRGRGLHPSDAQRRVIQGCTDSEELERWLLMAGRVNSIDELQRVQVVCSAGAGASRLGLLELRQVSSMKGSARRPFMDGPEVDTKSSSVRHCESK